jgi:hypothetical protein
MGSRGMHNGIMQPVNIFVPVTRTKGGFKDWGRGLSLEKEGFLSRLFVLLSDLGQNGLHNDDGENARLMAIDVRKYRRLKNRLVALGKIKIERSGGRNGVEDTKKGEALI